MSDLRVTLVQSDLRWQDPVINRNRLAAAIQAELVEQGTTDLVVLPEMFTTGFTMDTTRSAETMSGPTLYWMQELALATSAVICGSLIIEADGLYYNRFLWMPPTGKPEYYDKRHLFRMAAEEQHYSAGDRLMTVQLKGWRVRPFICYDLRFPVWCRNRDDYDLMLLVASWPADRREIWQILLQARAAENLSWLVAVNRVGQDANGIEYSGDSAVIDPQGQTVFAGGKVEMTRTVTLSRIELDRWRELFPAHLDADDFTLE